jgi:electron transfer flavoprotein beta subunit
MDRILVAIKQVASLDDEYELGDADRIPRDELEWDLNEWDAFSLEAALELRDATGAGEVVVVTVGGDESEEGLLECLAKGADRAIRVWDDALEDADVLAVARALAAVVAREQPDLVLCGVQSRDMVNGATGVALAGYADLPRVAVVRRVDVDDGVLTVERELEGGVVEVIRLRTPALLTIQTGINEPRYATLRAIKQARNKPLDVVGLADLGLSADDMAAGARTRSLRRQPHTSAAQMLSGSPADMAARVADIVKERLSG